MTAAEIERQEQRYRQERTVWDRCADTYEQQIVRGHPDVTAYESFEHSVMERMALFLTRDCGTDLAVYDFGCGSGRIHRFLTSFLPASKAAADKNRDVSDQCRGMVRHVGGVDFSENMITLALKNLEDAGMKHLHPAYLSYDVGSAFDVPPYTGNALPLAVSVCNSIGVMQGPEGAAKLFESMGRYVREQKGIALISCYCREAVAGYALGNYESTMDVCGQPAWLEPDTWAREGYTIVPRYYKRAYDASPEITVDVFDTNGICIQRGVVLIRDEAKVRTTVETGQIETCTEY
ncbi:MAG: hypothetical protein JW863_22590, partial [Chitinispirillaceae bacterium]|nr:hypothetical protein [Chitinispirillaceae bacterium]